MASTSARNDPEMRWLPWLTANQSVASASASSTRTSDHGSQSAAVDVSAAVASAPPRTAVSATARDVDLLDIRQAFLLNRLCRQNLKRPGALELASFERPPELHDDARIAQ